MPNPQCNPQDLAPREPTAAASARLPAPATPVTIESATLFRGGREVRIVHGGMNYRLTITRLNKLILTK